jgi:hypothetical protein
VGPRRRWILIGAVLGVAGLLLAYFPLPQPSSSQTLPTVNSEYIIDYAAPLDLLFPRVHFSLEWVGSQASSGVTVFGCNHDSTCSHPGTRVLASGHGATGRASFLGWANLYYEVLPISGATTITVDYAAPVLGGAIGFGLIAGGILLVAIAFAPRRLTEEGEDDLPSDDPGV